MAKISISKPKEEYSASSREMRVGITETESGMSYEFILRRKHIEVIQLEPQNGKKHKIKPAPKDWFTTLTEQEKVQAFAPILQEYRNRSLGDNGFKGASIGVAADQLNGQSRIFIGTNTTRWASPYFKHCAEQNMVNAATDTLTYEKALDPARKDEKPRPPKLKSVYVMQATDDGAVKACCPCGKCTDMLSKVMERDGQVITMPLISPEMQSKLLEEIKPIELNKSASSLNELHDIGSKTHYEVWQTSIENLNRHREIELKGPIRNIQHNAVNAMLKKVLNSEELPENRAVAEYKLLADELTKSPNKPTADSAAGFVASFINYADQAKKLFSQTIRKLMGTTVKPAEKAAQNVMRKRKSEAVLDCAVDSHGIDISVINHFMAEKIMDTFLDRAAKQIPAEKSKNGELRKWFHENIASIRCVAIQLDDGTFRYAVQADTKFDNAMPHAEVVALENAVESLGRNGVHHVWAMEMSPKDIDAGIMRTSPKEGIERLLKRASKYGIHFHYLPFNDGTLPQEKIKQAMVNFDNYVEIYPSGFRGVGTSDRCQHHAAKRPESWQNFVSNANSSTQGRAPA